MSAREPSIHPHVVGAGVTLTGPVELMVKFPQKGLTHTVLSLLNYQILNGTEEDRKMALSFLENGVELLKHMISEEQRKGAQ